MLSVAGVFLACSKTSTDHAGADVRAVAPAASVASSEAALEMATLQTQGEPETALAPEVIPTEAEYEAEAERKLTQANLDLELDELTREIGE
jgi:hypothetical protein